MKGLTFLSKTVRYVGLDLRVEPVVALGVPPVYPGDTSVCIAVFSQKLIKVKLTVVANLEMQD